MGFSRILSIALISLLWAQFSSAAVSTYVTGNCGSLCHVEIDWDLKTYRLTNWGSVGRNHPPSSFEFATQDNRAGIIFNVGTFISSPTFFYFDVSQSLKRGRGGSTSIQSIWSLISGGLTEGVPDPTLIDGDWKFDPPLELCGENCVMRIDSKRKHIKRLYLDGSQPEYDFPIFSFSVTGTGSSTVIYLKQDIFTESPYDLTYINGRIIFPNQILPDLVRVFP